MSYDDAVIVIMPGGAVLRPDGVPVGEFGDKFRKEREKKGISLDDVSNVTKIGSRMLQAIEEEHFDRLPGGVFNKGFIRAYAKHLGLNDDEAVTEYLACLRQAQIDAQASWQPQTRESAPVKRLPAETGKAETIKKESKAPPPTPVQTPSQGDELPELHLPRAEHLRSQRQPYLKHGVNEIPWRIVAVATVIIVLAAVLWHRNSRSSTPQGGPNPPSANQTTLTSASGATAPTPPGIKPGQGAEARSTTQNPQTPPGTRPAATPAAEPASENAAHTEGTTVSPTAAHSRSAATAAPPLSLVIRASENSWVSVSADGQAASQETLIAPAHTSVRARQEVVVRVGNAAGVSFLFNGKEIPPQGSESEVKTLVFDSSGLKTTLPGLAPTTVN